MCYKDKHKDFQVGRENLRAKEKTKINPIHSSMSRINLISGSSIFPVFSFFFFFLFLFLFFFFLRYSKFYPLLGKPALHLPAILWLFSFKTIFHSPFWCSVSSLYDQKTLIRNQGIAVVGTIKPRASNLSAFLKHQHIRKKI